MYDHYLDSQLAAVLYSCNRDGSAAVRLRDVSIHYWFAQLTTPSVLPSECININMATVCKKNNIYKKMFCISPTKNYGQYNFLDKFE